MRELDDHYGDLATAIDDREIELVHILEEEVSKFAGILLSVNDDLAELDWYDPFPTVTFERAWVRPTILNQNTIQIIAGRHPLVEGCVENYIPNDTHLVASAPSKAQRKKRKSTESYTEEAHVGIHDAVFTRVSTTESASRSSSAFMIDLLRVSFMSVCCILTSTITKFSTGRHLSFFPISPLTTVSLLQHRRLRNCTARSLLLIDEFGKGTDPTDGQALFCGVIEHLISRGSSCPITLVSTHFHGVFTNGFLSLDLPIDYTHMCIVLKDGGGPEEENSPTYLYKLAPDLVSSSHAMGCAAQAGVPRHIRLKADRVSRLLSRHEILELLDVRLDEDEREELGRMEETVRRFVAIDFEQDGLSSCRDWMAYLRENVLENER
ncbi:MutS protein msh5 [Puccinia graminis f. sp. tritici]|uniref:MutS protein msh5 n=1 Tax=Puccinia graminis f. sp. tritici TaxID=56615 RepID=A0A5B0NDC3_PUCGR|nr:MutS protein msh5 [Puccinia graminis f. sp. tritici]